MRIFICALLFIFIIFLNSVQSMNKAGTSRYQHTSQKRLRVGQIVYLRGHPEGCIFKLVLHGMKELFSEKEAKDIWMHWEQLPILRGERPLESGDLLVRQRKAIAKLEGLSFHGIVPEYAGQENVQTLNGDMVFRLGNPIARYDENNVRRRIQFIDYTNNDDWLGQIEEGEF